MSKKSSELKDAHGIQSWGRKLIKEPREGEEIFFGNCSLGSALVLNQSFLFPWRCTLRQGTKIDLGMFQALSSAMSTYHSLPPPSGTLVLKQSQKLIIFLYSLTVKVCISGTNSWGYNQTAALIFPARFEQLIVLSNILWSVLEKTCGPVFSW